jgi:hypothetical protein
MKEALAAPDIMGLSYFPPNIRSSSRTFKIYPFEILGSFFMIQN